MKNEIKNMALRFLELLFDVNFVIKNLLNESAHLFQCCVWLHTLLFFRLRDVRAGGAVSLIL